VDVRGWKSSCGLGFRLHVCVLLANLQKASWLQFMCSANHNAQEAARLKKRGMGTWLQCIRFVGMACNKCSNATAEFSWGRCCRSLIHTSKQGVNVSSSCFCPSTVLLTVCCHCCCCHPSGSRACFQTAVEYLDGFQAPVALILGNHGMQQLQAMPTAVCLLQGSRVQVESVQPAAAQQPCKHVSHLQLWLHRRTLKHSC
jgi:hypothetical protein